MKFITLMFFIFLVISPSLHFLNAKDGGGRGSLENETLGTQLLFSLGQNMPGKGNSFLRTSYNNFHVDKQKNARLRFIYLYGITDRLSFLTEIPVGQRRALIDDCKKQHVGWRDIRFQWEWAYYKFKCDGFMHRATLLAGFLAPTSNSKLPRLDRGVWTGIVGGTTSYSSHNWYAYTAVGAELAQSKNKTLFGSRYSFDTGLGRVIKAAEHYYLATIWEFNFDYVQRRVINDETDPNSGRVFALFGQSLRWSYKRVLAQFGLQYPVIQNLRGNQIKINYRAEWSMAVRL